MISTMNPLKGNVFECEAVEIYNIKMGEVRKGVGGKQTQNLCLFH